MYKLQDNVESILPSSIKPVVKEIFSRQVPTYMKTPYFAVMPSVKVDNKLYFFYSKLTGIGIDTIAITTQGGISGPTRYTKIPVPNIFRKDIGDYITADNLVEVIKYFNQYDLGKPTDWIYMKGYELVELKLIELLSVMKYANISSGQVSLILNNVFNMTTEYSMWKYDDIESKVIYPPEVNVMLFKPNKLIDVTDTPQTEKNVYRLTIGAKIQDNKGIEGKYLISKIHAECPVPDKLAPNRMIVQRALTQSMELIYPDKPLVISGLPTVGVQTKNLLAARMEFRGLTHQDGIVISKSAASKFLAVSVHLDRVDGTQEDIKVTPIVASDGSINNSKSGREFIIRNFISLLRTMRDTDTIIWPGKTIAENQFGRKTKTTIKTTGIVTGILEINGKTFVESLSIHRLNIGDKIMDMHGHKGTIAEILPDNEMPQLVIDGKKMPLDIVFPPYVVKRGTPSREIEEYLSINELRNAEVVVDNQGEIDSLYEILSEFRNPHNKIQFEPVIGYKHEYTGPNIETVYTPETGNIKVPVGIVRVARLNHIAESKLAYYSSTAFSKTGKQVKFGYSMADNMFHLIKNKCKYTLLDISKDMNIKPVNDIFQTMGYKLTSKGILQVREKLTLSETELTEFGHHNKVAKIETPDFDREVSQESLDNLAGTIVDPALSDMFMAIKLPEYISGEVSIDRRVTKSVIGGEYIVIPPTETFILHDGTVTLNNIQTIVRRLLTQIASESQYSGQNILRLVSVLYHQISNTLFKKTGLIRSALFPRTSFTAYGVIVPNIDIKPDEILVPYRMLRYFSKSFSDEMKSLYKITPDMTPKEMDIALNNKYILATGFPSHREQNAIALKIRVWNEYAIGIHPSIVNLQDRDYDGDMEMLYLPKSKASMREIKYAFGLKRLIDEGLKLDRSRALRNLPMDIELEMDKIKWHLYKSTGLLDDKEHNERYKQLIKGLDIENDITESFPAYQKGADDISFMKAGAANAGNIGMTLRGLARTVQEIKYANDIYHILAQTALDGKNGQSDRELVIMLCDAIRFGNIGVLKEHGPKKFSEQEMEYLHRMIHDNKGQAIGIARKFAQEHPIGHMTTTGGVRDAGKEIKIEGAYEKLYSLAYNRFAG